jgi:hypothetical protein
VVVALGPRVLAPGQVKLAVMEPAVVLLSAMPLLVSLESNSSAPAADRTEQTGMQQGMLRCKLDLACVEGGCAGHLGHTAWAAAVHHQCCTGAMSRQCSSQTGVYIAGCDGVLTGRCAFLAS